MNFTNNNRNWLKYSAGILPVAIDHDGHIMFLVGRDKRRECWSDFGGHAENEDNSIPENTASREFYEETLGTIYNIQTMKSRLYNRHITRMFIDDTASDKTYFSYIMKIPYSKNIVDNFKKFYEFLKHINSPYRMEMNATKWVSRETIFSDDNAFIPLRPVFKKSIQMNRKEIDLWLEELFPNCR